MTILTRKNAKCGSIVERGPGWIYGDQDAGSIYGVVISIIFDENGNTHGVYVNWINENQVKIRQKNYVLPADEKDPLYGILQLSNALDANADPNTDAQEGEVRPYLVEEVVSNWNNAMELAIDTVNDNKSRKIITEKLSSFKKELKVKQP